MINNTGDSSNLVTSLGGSNEGFQQKDTLQW